MTIAAQRTPTFADVIRRAIDARLAEVHTAIPAKVEAFDAATQLAEVKPLVQAERIDETGARVVEPLPVIVGVPVVFPGANGFRVTFPITQGDTVLLVFSEASIDNWLEQGTDVDPGTPRRFHIKDAIAIPGLHPKSKAWTGVSGADMTLGKDGGPQVVVKSSTIELGGHADDPPTDAVALASKVEQDLNTLKNAINSAPVAPNDGGATFKAALGAALSAWPSSLGSTVIKSK